MVSFLTSTEQKLDLRANTRMAFGRLLVRSTSTAWGVKVGFNRNNERYSDETPDRDSWEAFLGTELDLYDIEDIDLSAKLDTFPGLTETKEFRADSNLDSKFDLPWDFYIKLGFVVNYDNLLAEGAEVYDYVLKSGFGWEW